MRSSVPFDSPAVERGTGVFETVLVVGRRAVLWEAHVARLLGTLRRFDLPAPSSSTLLVAAREALSGAGLSKVERALRLAWIAVGSDLDAADSWRLHASVRLIPPSTIARRAGSRAVTLPRWLRRDTPAVKSTSYFSAVAGLRMARRGGGDEGLFVDEDGSYLEGTSTGLVCWDGSGWVLPEGPSLPSVSRAALAPGAPSRPLSFDDLTCGSVLAGSLTKAVPIVSIDGVPCALPPGMADAARDFSRKLLVEDGLGSEL